MGLVDKVLETLKAWTICEVESLPEAADQIREVHRTASETHAVAKTVEENARVIAAQEGNANEVLAAHAEAKAATKEAKSAERRARINHHEMVEQHNARLHSLSQGFDVIFRSHKTKKEHCHGGKCNGVNCMRIMEKASVLLDEFAVLIKTKKIPTKTDAEIDSNCQQFANLLGTLDAIWSSVRGTDSGLLPADVQLEHLKKSLHDGKELWLSMGTKTKQPKWHLTFDGHLLCQVRKCGGLADKADDTTEFQHQMLLRLKDRCQSIPSCRMRELCVQRELRRERSPEIESHTVCLLYTSPSPRD